MRKRTPVATETEVIIASRRRCALCFGLHGDLALKQHGQLAHINHDASDCRAANLCFLCLEHHNEYDSTTSQGKGLLESELRHYRKNLLQIVEAQPALMWTDALASTKNSNKRRSSDYAIVRFYGRRIRIYRAAMVLIGTIMKVSRATPEELWTFVRATDEAAFLFDDEVAEYLFDLYKKVVYLEYIGKELEQVERGPERNKLTSEEMEILIWFGEQFSALREKLAPFLRA